jgi:pilus assembly protein Flp/PilA
MLSALVSLQSALASATDRLKREETGAAAVEYGLIIGFIAIAVIVALVALGPQIASLFADLSQSLTNNPVNPALGAPAPAAG